MQLIANSGIQFYKFDLKIDPNDDIIKTMGFWEKIDFKAQRVTLEYAVRLPEDEVWVSRRQLLMEGYLDENNELLPDINTKVLSILDEETDCFYISDIETPLEYYENEWLPLPYFRNNEFGPTNWCRIKLIPINLQSRIKEYRAILAFDTKTSAGEDLETPVLDTEYNNFSLCDDVDKLLNFCDKTFGGDWINTYLKEVHDRKEEFKDETFELKYLGRYIYLVKYLQTLNVCPVIELHSDDVENPIDVDLVLDIGNSNTFGVLIENTPNQKFNFHSVEKLKIQDLTQPENDYGDPFSMRLAFHKCDFGEMGGINQKFQWPSFIRVGKEAKRLIYNTANTISTKGRESMTNHSSPKRYLWDTDKSDVQWELILTAEDMTKSGFMDTSIYLEGITEQFTKDGSFTKSVDFGTRNQFSRKALMTFVFIEIVSHAMVQINSEEFRTKHGDSNIPRKLRRILITCPTAMVQAEQIILRQCAEEAAMALSRYHKVTYRENYDDKADTSLVEIIPGVKDLKKDLTLIDTKKDWIYDEASCCQLVFLYAEISERYLNNCEKYFDLYGRHRTDLGAYDKKSDLGAYDKKSLTIGSIDIGAGTTDLMINAYKYDDEGTAVLTPVPLYWESFSYAGDDLLKEIIRQIIIEGEVEKDEFIGCSGLIKNEAQKRGIIDIDQKLNNFFGTNSNNFDFTKRQLRKKFNVQVSIPIAERYMEHAQKNGADEIFTFEDFFSEYQPNADILDFFEDHFGYKFQDIRWKLSTKKVNEIVERFFEPFIKQLSVLLHVMKCDFILLAGRPTTLPKIGDLFLKFYPVSPDKIITLNNYRVGKWYPFQDGTGKFTDQKSIVAVGAAIAMMGGRLDKLSGFRLNMDFVKKRLISTAQNFGIYDTNSQHIDNVFISPDTNKAEFKVSSLPLMIGFKRLAAKTYRGRIIYLLDFDDDKIREKRKEHHEDLDNTAFAKELELYKTNLKNRMPFRVSISRQYRQNRELLTIESVKDKNKQLLKSIFKLKLKTLDEDTGYWLDTGQFVLGIK
jgi:hypothetical protein